jgi:hypothetical protein
MTRRPDGPGNSALYAWLTEREESEERAALARGFDTPGTATRLAALRAGEPVDVAVGDLPPWAREGEAAHWWRRATVTADGSVQFHNDDGSAWLAENGL